MTEVTWGLLPMHSAPRDGNYIIVKRPKLNLPIIVLWTDNAGNNESGLYLEEGALFQDDDFVGWWPLPNQQYKT